MHKIYAVILCYQAFDKTIKCIQSFRKQVLSEKYSLNLVIVDNNSPDHSGENLLALQDEKTTVVLCKENLGFAKGNNIGFRIAKDNGADIIILSNNDILISDINFISKLMESYEKKAFDIAGPKIISCVDKTNQNPVARQYRSIRDIKRRVLKLKTLNILSYFNIDELGQKIYRGTPKTEFHKEPDMDDFQLHGAFMIFGKHYVDNYDGLYDKTYMYGEENIIKYICLRDSLIMSYLPNITVYHDEGASTKMSYSNDIRRRRFTYKYGIHSCQVLLDLIKSDEKKNIRIY